jgi:hypothetical protein
MWRSKLTAVSGHAATPAQPAAFIDLGAIANTVGVASMAHRPASVPTPTAGIDIRIDLGGGIVLTITRHRCSSLKARYAYFRKSFKASPDKTAKDLERQPCGWDCRQIFHPVRIEGRAGATGLPVRGGGGNGYA